MPSEQPREGTRVKVVFTRAEAEALLLASDGYFSPDATNLGLGANKIAAALEPAQPQPKGEGDDLAARLEDAATTAQRIGAKHREEGNSAASSYYRGQRNAYNEAAQLARASTHPEQSERIVGAALDLLDSLGAPHYHDLIGMTYTLRKEQADNLRAALEPASPTPTEQGEARVDPDPLCSVCGHPRSDHDDGEGWCRGDDSDGCVCPGFTRADATEEEGA